MVLASRDSEPSASGLDDHLNPALNHEAAFSRLSSSAGGVQPTACLVATSQQRRRFCRWVL